MTNERWRSGHLVRRRPCAIGVALLAPRRHRRFGCASCSLLRGTLERGGLCFGSLRFGVPGCIGNRTTGLALPCGGRSAAHVHRSRHASCSFVVAWRPTRQRSACMGADACGTKRGGTLRRHAEEHMCDGSSPTVQLCFRVRPRLGANPCVSATAQSGSRLPAARLCSTAQFVVAQVPSVVLSIGAY